MAKIVIAGDAVVVTSALKLEDIRTIEKHRPMELVLKDGDESIFAIGTTCTSGTINEYGVSFGRETHDEQKLAVVTMQLEGIAQGMDVKDWVVDHIGTAIINLNRLEAKLPAVLAEIWAEREAVLSNITVAQ